MRGETHKRVQGRALGPNHTLCDVPNVSGSYTLQVLTFSQNFETYDNQVLESKLFEQMNFSTVGTKKIVLVHGDKLAESIQREMVYRLLLWLAHENPA